MSNGERTSENIEPFLSTSLKHAIGSDRGQEHQAVPFNALL